MLEDAGALTQGIHDALARLIQRQMGFPGRTRLRHEAKRLTSLVLTGISPGSGILECESLPLPDIPTRPPAVVAAIDLVHGIEEYQAGQPWPAYLPAVVRNRIGSAVAHIVSDNSYVSIAVQENGRAASCTISAPTGAALQETETFEISEPVEVVGRIFELNRGNRTFKVDTAPRKVTIQVTEEQFHYVDKDLRWHRVFVAGTPQDEKCRVLDHVTEMRHPTDEEEEGISIPSEMLRGERTVAYRAAAEKAEALLQLTEGYSTYRDIAVVPKIIDFALKFLRDTATVLLEFGIEPPTPFLVPTPMGGVQFEWRVEGRELELEIPDPENFLFLAVDGEKEQEGRASRWQAVRLVRWVATGEEV